MKAMREGRVDDYKKHADSYRQSFLQAGLKTAKESSSAESFSLGVNAETIEKYTPAEYYKDKKLFSDFDSVGDYYKRLILRPIKNLMFGTNERDSEFFVKDEGDADGEEFVEEE